MNGAIQRAVQRNPLILWMVASHPFHTYQAMERFDSPVNTNKLTMVSTMARKWCHEFRPATVRPCLGLKVFELPPSSPGCHDQQVKPRICLEGCSKSTRCPKEGRLFFPQLKALVSGSRSSGAAGSRYHGKLCKCRRKQAAPLFLEGCVRKKKTTSHQKNKVLFVLTKKAVLFLTNRSTEGELFVFECDFSKLFGLRTVFQGHLATLVFALQGTQMLKRRLLGDRNGTTLG